MAIEVDVPNTISSLGAFTELVILAYLALKSLCRRILASFGIFDRTTFNMALRISFSSSSEYVLAESLACEGLVFANR